MSVHVGMYNNIEPSGYHNRHNKRKTQQSSRNVGGEGGGGGAEGAEGKIPAVVQIISNKKV